jgi:hypothetical protein
MNTLLVFIAFALVLGLWSKPKLRAGGAILAVVVVAMMIFYWLFPSNF